MNVRQIMTVPVVTVSEDTPLSDVAATLVRDEINGVPVIDKTGDLVGFVAEGDVLPLETFGDGVGGLGKEPRRENLPSKASDVMNPEVISVTGDVDVGHAARLMGEYEIKQLPVVSSEGRLVGIVARRDVLGRYMRRHYTADVIEPDEEC